MLWWNPLEDIVWRVSLRTLLFSAVSIFRVQRFERQMEWHGLLLVIISLTMILLTIAGDRHVTLSVVWATILILNTFSDLQLYIIESKLWLIEADLVALQAYCSLWAHLVLLCVIELPLLHVAIIAMMLQIDWRLIVTHRRLIAITLNIPKKWKCSIQFSFLQATISALTAFLRESLSCSISMRAWLLR